MTVQESGERVFYSGEQPSKGSTGGRIWDGKGGLTAGFEYFGKVSAERVKEDEAE